MDLNDKPVSRPSRQEIVAVLDASVASRLSLRLGDGVFMMHSDSRRLGKPVLSAIFEEAFQAGGKGHEPDGLWTILPSRRSAAAISPPSRPRCTRGLRTARC
jgi:hypothetical protein